MYNYQLKHVNLFTQKYKVCCKQISQLNMTNTYDIFIVKLSPDS